MFYGAYGSNLNLQKMMLRCPQAKVIKHDFLSGYELAFRGSEDGYGYLTIEKSEDGLVPMGIFMVSESDMRKLDMYEGYPDLYHKEKFDLNGLNTYVYIMNRGYGYCIPSEHYLELCRNGYQDFGYDVKFLQKALKKTLDKKGIRY